VNVNGHELTLFIDTGATTIDLSPEAGQAVGAQVTAEAQGVFAGGKAAGVSKTSLAQVQLGGLTVTAVPAEMIAGLSSLALDGKHVDGAIGAQFLYHFLSTIDYRRKLLVLRPASDSAAFEEAAAKRGADLQPMWLVGDHFIFARAHINDAPEALFNIDTGGAGIGVQLTDAALDAAFVAPNIAAAQVVHGGGGDVKAVPFQAQVTFGTLTERNVHGVVFPEGDQYGLFPFTVAGTLTHEFFRSTALTFDFVAMRMLAE
jgi:predicted aspartyl protease